MKKVSRRKTCFNILNTIVGLVSEWDLTISSLLVVTEKLEYREI